MFYPQKIISRTFWQRGITADLIHWSHGNECVQRAYPALIYSLIWRLKGGQYHDRGLSGFNPLSSLKMGVETLLCMAKKYKRLVLCSSIQTSMNTLKRSTLSALSVLMFRCRGRSKSNTTWCANRRLPSRTSRFERCTLYAL